MERLKITAPLSESVCQSLHVGQQVLISGIIFTARDAAHKRMVEALEKGLDLPIDLNNQIVYYVGPSPAKPGQVIGAAGPTTSYRMDPYTPYLLGRGLKGMIGKGNRSPVTIAAMIQYGAVYFAAIGGAGALLSSCIIESEVIAYKELGTEAIRRLTVVDFPAIVAIDAQGNNLYNGE